jgi:16S rRNA (cytidine1402-2'-O)-methyltransferase
VQRTPSLLAELEAGRRVVVVTDAGMPSVSDPGYRLVVAAIQSGHQVTAVPGPSAVLTALAVSGLPVDRFCFEGFLPRKPGERARRLAELVAEPRTLIFFEAPHRTAGTLGALVEAFGEDRPAAVCRELTKTYEEVRRGTLAELAAWAAEDEVRGEITLVVAGAPKHHDDLGEAADEVRVLVAAGAKLKPAVAQVAETRGLAKNVLYAAALKTAR